MKLRILTVEGITVPIADDADPSLCSATCPYRRAQVSIERRCRLFGEALLDAGKRHGTFKRCAQCVQNTEVVS